MDLENTESLKGEEAKLELELNPMLSEILDEAVNLNGDDNDNDEATRREKVKQHKVDFGAHEGLDDRKKEPVLLNFGADSTETTLAVTMATTKVFRNPLILTKILQMLDTAQVFKNCRLVSLAWRDLSTDILLGRKSLHVRLVRESKSPPHQHQQQQHFSSALQKGLKLSQLNRLIPPQTDTRSNYKTRFPCVNFGFDGDLNCADAQEFLDTHGKNIKGLILSDKSNMEFIKKILVEQARNVESLELQLFQAVGDGVLFPDQQNPPKNPPIINLPFLTCFTIDGHVGCPNSLLHEIVHNAPNLQKCLGIWKTEEIQPFLSRIHLFNELCFNPKPTQNENQLALWEQLADKNLMSKVEILAIEFTDLDYRILEDGAAEEMVFKVDGISSKLLQATQRTLKQFRFYHSRELENHIKWPKMVTMEELVIARTPFPRQEDEDANRQASALKCPTLEISQCFPNLQTLSFSSIDTEKSGKLFNGQLLSLNSLSISESPELFNQCHKTFPNITHLSLRDIKDGAFPRIAPKIWTMKQLKTLHLDLNCSTCSVEEIDAVFTGMEKKTCEFLRTLKSKKRTDFGDAEIDKLRVRPSILNLTELKCLVFLGEPKRRQNEEEQQQAPENVDEEGVRIPVEGVKVKSRGPSFVSFEYAFKLMPKLQVFDRR